MNKTKKIFIIFFSLIILLPVMLMAIKALFLIDVDVELNGYTDSVEEQELTFKSFISGEYQSSAAMYLDEQMPLRGVYTKTYNTVRFNLFNEGKRPVGKDNYIYESNYINSELSIGKDDDFSSENNLKKMNEFIGHLSSVQQKLNNSGKDLYVYVIPSKAHVFSDKIPQKYVVLKNDNKPYIADLFREQIAATGIKTLFCEDLLDELEYPSYYPSGIHWSRTYEQVSSQRIVNDLAELTGKQYRNITFTDVEESSTPFWRDADVWELANIWNKLEGTFYQYSTVPSEYDYFEKMRILIYGDSFVHGLRKDILEILPEDEIYYVNYDNYIMDSDGQITVLDHDWSNLDFQYYLDNTDVVVVEMVDSMIKDCTLGFIEQLDAALDSYVPNKAYLSSFDSFFIEDYDMSDTFGVYERGGEYAWTKKEFSFTLQSSGISDNGLLIRYGIASQIIDKMGVDTVTFYVNGQKMAEKSHTEAGTYELYLSPEMLNSNDEHIYTIFGKSSYSFVPKEIGQSEDSRELAIQIKYVGEAE